MAQGIESSIIKSGTGGGVTSVNTLTGAVVLAAGTNVTITPSGNTLTIAATAGGGGVSNVTASAPVVSSGGSTPNISMAKATTSVDGYLAAADFTIFNNKQPAGSYITALTGDVTAAGPGSSVATLATVNGNVGSFGTATQVGSFTVNAKGLITAASNTSIQIAESQVTNLVTDLAGKQATGNYIIGLTGDGTASGPGNAVLTLATVNANVGSFGSASSVATFTVNGKGLITAAASTSIQITESQVTNLVSDLAGKQATGNYITALTGDVTAAGPGSVAATIANNAVTNAKLAQMPMHTFKGNNTGSTANALDLTQTQLTAELNTFTTTLKGLVAAPGSVSGNFLRDDGTFQPVTAGLIAWLTKSANYTLTSADDSVGFSTGGSTLVAQLPTAIGISGKRFIIKKVDAGGGSITVTCFGGQLIDGTVATTPVSIFSELVEIESDGAGWQMVRRQFDGSWNSNLTFSVSSFGATTNNHFNSRRVGDCLEVIGYFKSGTLTGSVASVNLPSGYTVDFTKTPDNFIQQTSEVGAYSALEVASTNLAISDRYNPMIVSSGNPGSVYFSRTGITAQFQAENANNLGSSNIGFAVRFTVPISGWTAWL